MPKRRIGTVPSHTMWTETTVKAIDAYQAKHNIPSFSAAAETLVRLGLDQSPGEVVQPLIASVIRRELERVVELISYNVIGTGVAQRLAGAALLAHYRTTNPKTAEADYDAVKQAARSEAGRVFASANVITVLRDVLEAHDVSQAG